MLYLKIFISQIEDNNTNSKNVELASSNNRSSYTSTGSDSYNNSINGKLYINGGTPGGDHEDIITHQDEDVHVDIVDMSTGGKDKKEIVHIVHEIQNDNSNDNHNYNNEKNKFNLAKDNHLVKENQVIKKFQSGHDISHSNILSANFKVDEKLVKKFDFHLPVKYKSIDYFRLCDIIKKQIDGATRDINSNKVDKSLDHIELALYYLQNIDP